MSGNSALILFVFATKNRWSQPQSKLITWQVLVYSSKKKRVYYICSAESSTTTIHAYFCSFVCWATLYRIARKFDAPLPISFGNKRCSNVSVGPLNFVRRIHFCHSWGRPYLLSRDVWPFSITRENLCKLKQKMTLKLDVTSSSNINCS